MVEPFYNRHHCDQHFVPQIISTVRVPNSGVSSIFPVDVALCNHAVEHKIAFSIITRGEGRFFRVLYKAIHAGN